MPNLQVVPEEYNQVSLAERDRRWTRIRKEMSTRGVDCLLVNGSSGRWNEMHANVRYIANYADNLSTISYAIFPLDGEGTLVTQMTVKRSNLAQCWFPDIRGRSTVDLPNIVAELLTELNLQSGTLGLGGMTFGQEENIGLPWNLYQAIRDKLPNLKLVDITDMFFELRSVKSDEEITCLENSAKLCDIAFKKHVELARPGILEREYYAGIVHAADAAGAEPPTFLLLNSGPMPREELMGDPLPSKRVLQKGDVICSEISPKWAGYQAQGLQCISLGVPSREMQELSKYAAEIFHKVADNLRPGNHLDNVHHAGDDVIERARAKLGGLADGLHPLVQAAGLGGPDTAPRPSELQPNQAFMIEIGPRQTQPQHVYGGQCIVTTGREPRYLHRTPIEEMLLKVVG